MYAEAVPAYTDEYIYIHTCIHAPLSGDATYIDVLEPLAAVPLQAEADAAMDGEDQSRFVQVFGCPWSPTEVPSIEFRHRGHPFVVVLVKTRSLSVSLSIQVPRKQSCLAVGRTTSPREREGEVRALSKSEHTAQQLHAQSLWA